MRSDPSGLLRGRDAYRVMHVVALALCAIMLPWSKALLSMAQLLLVANWMVEGLVRKDLGGRFKHSFTSTAALAFLSFLGLHVLGLAWTTDLEWGADLVRILLPVLAFGAVLAGAPRLQRDEFRTILLLGAWSAVVSTLICLALAAGAENDFRSLSAFVSHIRLALMLCLAVVVFLWDRSSPLPLRFAGYIAVVWCLVFLNKLGSIQGYLILVVIAVFFLWRSLRTSKAWLRWSLRIALVAIPALMMVLAVREVREHYRLPDQTLGSQWLYSAGGEIYSHELDDPQVENGTHVWTYMAWEELHRTWPLRSDRPIEGTDDKGHPIWSTLMRYLSSKGLRKDSVTVMGLSDADIEAIEQGVPNAMDHERSALRKRIDEVLFELGHYHAFGATDGHSVSMRLEYLKAGSAIAERNWLFGVGTGDTKQAFAAEYERMRSRLSQPWRHRAHNQYLTWLISFGVTGFTWALFALIWPAWRLGAWREPLFVAWAIIFGISCLTDDTIETQTGATFFAFYYALFVFAAPRSAMRS